MSDATPEPRPGSTSDLVRRMDTMERKHDELAKDVTTLTGTVNTVLRNQEHASELNKFRFDALDNGLSAARTELKDFIKRIEGYLTGETASPQQREAERWLADHTTWRRDVDKDRDDQQVINGQLRLLGRLALLLVGGNLVGTLIAIYAVLSK